jgi:hypothetical protein
MPEQKTRKGPDRTYVDAGKKFETDQFGKRKLDPDTQRQIKKATGELPNSVGQPKVVGSDEDEAFKRAHQRIAELKTSKVGVQDF